MPVPIQFQGSVLAAYRDGNGAARARQQAATPRFRDSGGSFGVKHAVFQHVVLMCLAARKAGAPVKWVEDRLERLMQRISRTLGIDELELRRRNFIPADAFPYRARAGALIDSGNYQLAIETAARKGGLEELYARRAAARAEGRLYGIGFAAIVEPCISKSGRLPCCGCCSE
jgi:CO/xanthine dehydrogenase Mo-binding subunit